MMYDDSNPERVVFSVDGKMRGVAVAGQDNNRTWLYWLEEPIEFHGGERVELRAAGAAASTASATSSSYPNRRRSARSATTWRT